MRSIAVAHWKLTVNEHKRFDSQKRVQLDLKLVIHFKLETNFSNENIKAFKKAHHFAALEMCKIAQHLAENETVEYPFVDHKSVELVENQLLLNQSECHLIGTKIEG